MVISPFYLLKHGYLHICACLFLTSLMFNEIAAAAWGSNESTDKMYDQKYAIFSQWSNSEVSLGDEGLLFIHIGCDSRTASVSISVKGRPLNSAFTGRFDKESPIKGLGKFENGSLEISSDSDKKNRALLDAIFKHKKLLVDATIDFDKPIEMEFNLGGLEKKMRKTCAKAYLDPLPDTYLKPRSSKRKK